MRISWHKHLLALRTADKELSIERDRRYAEVALEREKALRIKEESGKTALELAREIQTYKDEKANQLREQINSERGLYASKNELNAAVEEVEAMIRPVADYVSSQQGGPRAITPSTLVAFITTAAAIVALYFALHGK